MKKYLRIMRIDHWIKQLFIIPGCVCALLLTNTRFSNSIFMNFVVGFIATSLIASANYVINEWLDAQFDRFHPTKKNRSVVTEDVNGKIVWGMWVVLTFFGVSLGTYVGKAFVCALIFLWIMGILYNVKPFRTKDIVFLDVLSESINNAIRLLLGWFIISSNTIPPCSLIFGYWMAGAFLMAIKRYAEYRMIGDAEVAGRYRKSFKFYTEHSLLISAFFYAMCSVFFIGVFLIKYRIELVLFMPVLFGLYCYYFFLSFKPDSAVQKPEKLYKEKGLILYCIVLIILFIILMVVDISVLHFLVDSSIITF